MDFRPARIEWSAVRHAILLASHGPTDAHSGCELVTSSRVGAFLVAWLCAVFAALGAVVASIGPLLPELTRITQAPVSQVGLLISALFGGTLVSQALSALLMERFGTRAVIAGSLGACILGSVSLATAATLPWLLISSGVVGIGYGFGSVGINLLASRLLASRPGFVLNLCNACFGVGAVAGPLASGALLRQGGQAQQVFLIGGGLLVALLPFAFLLPLTSNDVRAADTGVWPSRRPLVALACLMALYGGIEAGFGGWLATYLQRTLAVTPASAAVMTSQYLGLLSGGTMPRDVRVVEHATGAAADVGGRWPGGRRGDAGLASTAWAPGTTHGNHRARRVQRPCLPADVCGRDHAIFRPRHTRRRDRGDRRRHRRNGTAVGNGPRAHGGRRTRTGRVHAGDHDWDVPLHHLQPEARP